jgi:hypothetical protein
MSARPCRRFIGWPLTGAARVDYADGMQAVVESRRKCSVNRGRRAARAIALAAAGVLMLFGTAAPFSAAADRDVYSPEERSHWSLGPRSQPEIPTFSNAAEAAWLESPVDAFVLARLRRADLSPAPPADRRTLVRRLYFNLTGLPPTPEEIDGFLGDVAPDAYERLIDRLLASPQYGEAWAQHWLDVSRYAESEGFEYDRQRHGAWRFRDYVVRSFNADKPYDRFVLEQIAGDELPVARASLPVRSQGQDGPATAEQEPLIAVGFHRLGPVRRNAGNSDVAFSRNEVLTEMTDAVGLVFLGLTVGCARCHDHMFDPVRQRDYYRLQAFLAATHEHDLQLGDAAEVKRWNAENDVIQAEIKRLRELLDDARGDERETLTYQLKAAQKKAPAPLPTISSVKNDAARRGDIHVLERGQSDKPKEIVGPRTLGVLLTSSDAEYPSDIDQPKTRLAQWLIDPSHPLTARVFVNRLWHYQFGQGIVSTPNDFGVNGSPPSHPELLDYLANELVRGEWSVKRLQRLLVSSSTFRQNSNADFGLRIADSSNSAADNPQSAIPNPQSTDPNNRLLWHFPRRRLAAEELRDAMLLVAGRLNSRFGGESIMPPVKQELVDLLYEPAQWQVTPDVREHDRRSIYLVAKRNLRLPFMEVFDQPDLLTSCPRRQSSTHAPQSLELLNGDLANDLAAAFAERLRAGAGDDRQRQVELAFHLATGRAPTNQERRLAIKFLDRQPLSEFALAMFNLNAFLYVE